METLKIGKEEFPNILWLNERMLNDYVHRMANKSFFMIEFREAWDKILERLIDFHFGNFWLQFHNCEPSIAVILRAGIAGLLAAKNWIINNNLPFMFKRSSNILQSSLVGKCTI